MGVDAAFATGVRRVFAVTTVLDVRHEIAFRRRVLLGGLERIARVLVIPVGTHIVRRAGAN